MNAPVYNEEDELFDILDRLKETNAVLVVNSIVDDLVGIVTSYDTAEYFRSHTEDLMRVADIEFMVKEWIKDAHTNNKGELDEAKLDETIVKVTAYTNKAGESNSKSKGFIDLTLTEYISIMLMKDFWSFYEPIFSVRRDFVKELLYGIRDIRNSLAHFRNDVTAEQRDRLKFGTEWFSSRWVEYQHWKQEQTRSYLFEENLTSPEYLSTNPDLVAEIGKLNRYEV